MNALNNLNLALYRFNETSESLVLIQIFVVFINNAIEAIVFVIHALLETLHLKINQSLDFNQEFGINIKSVIVLFQTLTILVLVTRHDQYHKRQNSHQNNQKFPHSRKSLRQSPYREIFRSHHHSPGNHSHSNRYQNSFQNTQISLLITI